MLTIGDFNSFWFFLGHPVLFIPILCPGYDVIILSPFCAYFFAHNKNNCRELPLEF